MSNMTSVFSPLLASGSQIPFQQQQHQLHLDNGPRLVRLSHSLYQAFCPSSQPWPPARDLMWPLERPSPSVCDALFTNICRGSDHFLLGNTSLNFRWVFMVTMVKSVEQTSCGFVVQFLLTNFVWSSSYSWDNNDNIVIIIINVYLDSTYLLSYVTKCFTEGIKNKYATIGA